MLAGMLVGVAHGGTVRMQVERIDAAAATLEGVVAELDWPQQAKAGVLQLDIARLRVAELGLDYHELRWRCNLSRDAEQWDCVGDVAARGLRTGKMQLVVGPTHSRLEHTRGSARSSVRVTHAEPERPVIATKAIPADWLQPLLTGVWPGATVTSGRLDADLVLHLDADRVAVEGEVAASGFGLDTADGAIATADLGARGKVGVVLDAGSRITAALSLGGGELLLGRAYIALPSSPVELAFTATQQGSGPWRIDDARWRDGDVLHVDANAQIDPAAEDPLLGLQLRATSRDLSALRPRYAEAVLASAGMPAASLSGGIEVELDIEAAKLQRLDLRMQNLVFDDGAQRLRLDGLEGTARWQQAATDAESALQWRAGALYGIGFGPASLRLGSRDGGLRLLAAMELDMLGGSLHLQRFAWQPQQAGRATELDFAMRLDRLDLARVSRQFGWPAFTGTLSGSIPGVRYEDQLLSMDGSLEMRLFDGEVRVDGLRMERPLGVAPTLSADIAFAELDLVPLTSVFGFGEISGRLQGSIAGLRLLDWSPVAFDARFETSTRAGVPRRISQRAVEDLSRVGGAGLAAGLQSRALRLFDTFGYARIGLGCRLANHVCEMSGLSRSGNSPAAGYTIVEGAGLPRITVNGFQRRVDWPVLVARLTAIGEGQAPEIRSRSPEGL